MNSKPDSTWEALLGLKIVMTFLFSERSIASVPRRLFGGFNAMAHHIGFNIAAHPKWFKAIAQWSWA